MLAPGQSSRKLIIAVAHIVTVQSICCVSGAVTHAWPPVVPLILAAALWGWWDSWLHGIPGAGVMESSSIPGSQEPSPATHRVSLEAEKETAWAVLLPGALGSHVCSCPCPDTRGDLSVSVLCQVRLSWGAELLATFTPRPCPSGCRASHTVVFPCSLVTAGKFVPCLWVLELAILQYLHFPLSPLPHHLHHD